MQLKDFSHIVLNWIQVDFNVLNKAHHLNTDLIRQRKDESKWIAPLASKNGSPWLLDMTNFTECMKRRIFSFIENFRGSYSTQLYWYQFTYFRCFFILWSEIRIYLSKLLNNKYYQNSYFNVSISQTCKVHSFVSRYWCSLSYH